MSTVHFIVGGVEAKCGSYLGSLGSRYRAKVTCPACLNRMNQEAPKLRARIKVLSQILKVRGAK